MSTTAESSLPIRADEAAPEHRHLGIALLVICTAQLMVVLDASIVNVALPSMERALHFTVTNLEWVINGYTLAFGGLLLLGGRTGDLFGRRRMFIVGIAIFSLSSLVGGFATTQVWLIAARVVQGIGGAIAAPAALSLIATTFPEGPPRNRAMGVYAAMSGAGGAVGVILGGVLTEELSWRWVLFVNVPIGLFVMLLAPRVLGETTSRRGRLDLSGALSATIGMTLFVYGLLHAASHSWSDIGTVIPLAVAVALLVSFVLIEARTNDPIMPLHIFADRNRSGAYGVSLAIGTALFGMFFFLTLFMQNVLGFSPLRAGVSYLPFALMIVVIAGIASQAVGKVGVRIPAAIGTLVTAGGMFWLAQVTPHSTYLGGVLGPMLMIAGGLALCFVPLTVVAVSGVRRDESGIASALLNTGQQVGGALGLATLGTIVASVSRHHLAALSGSLSTADKHAITASQTGVPVHLSPVAHAVVSQASTSAYTVGFSVGAGIMAVAFVLCATVIRVRAGDLAGVPGFGTE